jgi:hypothetical protein
MTKTADIAYVRRGSDGPFDTDTVNRTDAGMPFYASLPRSLNAALEQVVAASSAAEAVAEVGGERVNYLDLYACRLMVLNTAWRIERGLPHRQEVAFTKTFVSEAIGRILDRAVQIHAAAGIATDLPIAQWYADARAARIYDGASEVHRMTIARELLRLARSGESTRAGTGDLL